MTKIKKGNFIFSVCLLVVLAFFSFGLAMMVKPTVYASNTTSVTQSSEEDPLTNVEKNIVITAFYEERNSGAGGIFTEGATGGCLGKEPTQIDKRNITVDTNSQSVFYARANTGYYLDGIYPNEDFTGQKLDTNLNDDYYSITYNNETSSQYYAKFCIKRITITLENGADFTLSGEGTYLYGETPLIECEENSQNYKFSRWVKVIGNETTTLSENLSHRINAIESVRIRAVPKLLVGTKECLNGTIEIKQNDVVTTERYFEQGTNLQVKAIPSLGYNFVNYDLGEFLNNPQEFDYTVLSPLSFGAIFESKKVTVTISTDNGLQANTDGSTDVENRQFVIGDEITLKVNVTALFGLDLWQTNAHGEFGTHLVNQTYRITPQDAEDGTLLFLAKIKKMLASCEITMVGKGILYINDINTRTTLKEDKALSSSYLITAQEGNDYYLSDVIYKSLSSGEEQDWFDRLVENQFSFDVTEDFKLTFIFSPLTWSQIKVEPKGLGTKHSPYLINSAEELAYMEYGINYNIKAKTEDAVDYRKAYFKLTNNIDLNGRYWILIGANNNAKFEGTLDLNYKFITNITLVDDSYSSNLKYLFTAENSKIAHIIHDADATWRVIGISSSVFFGVALTIVLVAFLTNNKTQVKKVVVLKDKKSSKK